MIATFVPLSAALKDPPPWLVPLLPVVRRVLDAGESLSIAASLNAARDANDAHVEFVDHSRLPRDESYEGFIARTACIPTRDNLHDFFNGVMWLTYPKTKRRLNELQAQQIAMHGTSGPRGALRDALTLFDENAAVLLAPAELVDALRRRDWMSLFVHQRSSWDLSRLGLFGHALMEKLMQPRKSITAHVWLIDELTDASLASSLTQERLSAKPFLPMPVLGVPGWCKANENVSFYEDADVFRLPRLVID
ncbi:MAG: DUF3025 domain-containing protein [Povalibacter sp.]